MGDDWDPFAMEGAADPVNTSSKKETPATFATISKEDLDKVEDTLWGFICSMTPWKKSPKPYPDLTWYMPTCSLEDWRHKDVVTVEKGQQILYISINRPDANNMLNDKVMLALIDAVMNLQMRKSEFRMAVFSGVGKMFCAGQEPSGSTMNAFTKGPPKQVAQVWAEFKERGKGGGAFPDGNEDMARLLAAKFWHTFSSLPQFTVALVNGSAIAEGVALTACCDTVIAVENAFFNVADVQKGVVNALVVPYIEKKIGPALTKMVLCTGENLTAEKACFYGLVSEVVENVDEAHKKIATLASVLTQCGPRSVEAAKNLVIGVAGQQINEGIMFFTAQQLAMVTVSQEATDGMVCVQSRKPKPWEEEPHTIKCLYGN